MERVSLASLKSLSAELWRIARFSAVGLVASGVYALGMVVLTGQLHVDAVLASVIAYAVAIPVSFLGQKRFAFRSKGTWIGQFVRFGTTQGVNLVLSAALMYVVTELVHLPYQVGIVLVIGMIACLSYLAFEKFVFTGTR